MLTTRKVIRERRWKHKVPSISGQERGPIGTRCRGGFGAGRARICLRRKPASRIVSRRGGGRVSVFVEPVVGGCFGGEDSAYAEVLLKQAIEHRERSVHRIISQKRHAAANAIR